MKKYQLIVSISAALILSSAPAYANQWIQSDNDWYYVDENGQRIRNTISEDGYLVDYRGKYIPIQNTQESDREKSSNFFMKYLETGDSKYLTGSEYITVPAPRSQGFMFDGAETKEVIYPDYVDYQSCLGGYFFPTRTYIINSTLGWRVSKVYPEYVLQGTQNSASNSPYSALDENNMPLYYKPNELHLTNKGDFLLLDGAQKKGLQVHEVTWPSTGQTYNVITQRDAYKAYKNFIDMATAGTENMSERELALHLERVVTDYLYYSNTLLEETIAYPKPESYSSGDFKLMATILAESGVCENYSTLYKHLCDITGLNCKCEADREYNGVGHIWNLVEIDGTWYHVDATWADGNNQYAGLMKECHIKGENCDLITGKNSGSKSPFWSN